MFGRKVGKKPTYVGKKPTFKSGFGHKKPSVHAGLREKSPLAHFYFYLIVIKRLRIYIDMAKISGHLTKGVKTIFFTNHIGRFSFAKKTYPFMKREG